MLAVLVVMLAIGAALWVLDVVGDRRKRAERQRSLEKQEERRRRQDEIVQRRRELEVRRKRWVTRFIWKNQRARRITYQPPETDED